LALVVVVGTKSIMTIPPTATRSSEEKNKAIIRRFYEEVWNNGRLELVDELVSPVFVNHGFGSVEGDDREAFKHTINRVRDELNFRPTIEELTAEGDTVVARVSGHGETGGKAARREGIVAIGAIIWKLRNGQITERWAFWQPDAGE
jgi:ketosteroid isomerase-like protein